VQAYQELRDAGVVGVDSPYSFSAFQGRYSRAMSIRYGDEYERGMLNAGRAEKAVIQGLMEEAGLDAPDTKAERHKKAMLDLVKPKPIENAKVPAWQWGQEDAAATLKASGATKSELRREYWAYLLKEYKTDETRAAYRARFIHRLAGLDIPDGE